MKKRSTTASLLFGLLCAALAICATPALAHDSLRASTPGKNAVVSGLDHIELEFSAHVSFPVVVLHDAAGRRFESGAPRTDGPKVTVDVAGPLPSGGYTVAWRVVSSDGHPVEGEIPFTVRSSAAPAAGDPAPAGTPVAATGATDDQGGGMPGWIWVVLAGLVLVGAGALLTGRAKKPAETAADPDPES
ncbi:copper resistance protein CopC [Microbispora sp. RL4-1S]|uniref:Copper resistance protein CopC n=1 Tax=Microbispora oryzae TaxID=2806554 RepID=A0A940WJP0_9ACTN|nr:copper resistance protein CopC [Microbispora oryzae]MBP2704512.1 copper resistance protein CopC [Microbispora oryzae]